MGVDLEALGVLCDLKNSSSHWHVIIQNYIINVLFFSFNLILAPRVIQYPSNVLISWTPAIYITTKDKSLISNSKNKIVILTSCLVYF